MMKSVKAANANLLLNLMNKQDMRPVVMVAKIQRSKSTKLSNMSSLSPIVLSFFLMKYRREIELAKKPIIQRMVLTVKYPKFIDCIFSVIPTVMLSSFLG